MSGIADRIEKAFPGEPGGFGANVVSLHQQMVGDVERSLVVLMAAVGFVLLIACANLGNLMLGRTAARRKELAIRTALGARRWRLVRQIVTETFVLAMVGSGLGLLLAYWATGFFIRWAATAFRGPMRSPSTRGFCVHARARGRVALLAGLVPALQASRAPWSNNCRKADAKAGAAAAAARAARSSPPKWPWRSCCSPAPACWCARCGACSTWIAGSRLTASRSMTVSLPAALFAGPPEVRGFYARLLERVRALPGVEAAATATGVLQPLVTNSRHLLSRAGRSAGRQQIEYPVEIVSPGFFETLSIPLAPDGPSASRTRRGAAAVVVNETLARLAWPGQEPIGRRMKRPAPIRRRG